MPPFTFGARATHRNIRLTRYCNEQIFESEVLEFGYFEAITQLGELCRVYSRAVSISSTVCPTIHTETTRPDGINTPTISQYP